MKSLVPFAVAVIAAVASAELPPATGLVPDGAFRNADVWNDGLVEKATYAASRPIYGRARSYEAIFLTNLEDHTAFSNTKSVGRGDSFQVWKHNQIERIPTPNYDYTFVTTTHVTSEDLTLTRLDQTSQEWCGTSYRQFSTFHGDFAFFEFSYMPGTGQAAATVPAKGSEAMFVPLHALPLVLRAYDFDARPEVRVRTSGDLKSNRPVDPAPVDAVVTYAGAGDGMHKLVVTSDAGAVLAELEFQDTTPFTMTSYRDAGGQTYTLTGVERVDYWTVRE